MLIPVHRGVYRHAAHPESTDQRILAATLACGTTAVASHATAGWAWWIDGLRRRDGTELVHVSVPETRAPAPRDGVQVHRSSDLVVADLDRRRSIPVTSAARTLIDVAATIEPAHLELALDDAEQRGLVWRPHLRWRLDQLGSSGRTGVPQLRALLDRTEGRPLGDS